MTSTDLSGAGLLSVSDQRRRQFAEAVFHLFAEAFFRLFLEPIFEADFEDNVYAYRPERSAHDALTEVRKRLYEGQQHVVDADLTKYFDTIPHAELLQSVARRVADGRFCTCSSCG